MRHTHKNDQSTIKVSFYTSSFGSKEKHITYMYAAFDKE